MTNKADDSQGPRGETSDDRDDDLSIRDASAERSFFTLLPNAILSLRLSPFALVLYVHLKRVTGDGGACFKKSATLVEETGMSAGSISAAKKELARPRAELGGKPLIVVEERKRTQGGKPLHYITLTDVWADNFAAFVRPEAISCGEIASSPDEQAISPGEIKKIPPDQKPSDQDHTPARTRAREVDAPSAAPPAVCVSRFSALFRKKYAEQFGLGGGWLQRSQTGEFDNAILVELKRRNFFDVAKGWCTERDAEVLDAEVGRGRVEKESIAAHCRAVDHGSECPGCFGSGWDILSGKGARRCTVEAAAAPQCHTEAIEEQGIDTPDSPPDGLAYYSPGFHERNAAAVMRIVEKGESLLTNSRAQS